jgi:hypothetical protein
MNMLNKQSLGRPSEGRHRNKSTERMDTHVRGTQENIKYWRRLCHKTITPVETLVGDNNDDIKYEGCSNLTQNYNYFVIS